MLNKDATVRLHLTCTIYTFPTQYRASIGEGREREGGDWNIQIRSLWPTFLCVFANLGASGFSCCFFNFFSW